MFETPPQSPYSTPAPSTPTSFSSPPPRPSRRRWIIIGACFSFLCIVGLVVLIVSRNNSPACLDADSYRALTGTTVAYDAISPKNGFYTDYVIFKPQLVTYDDTSDDAAHGTKLIEKLATFYKAHQAQSIRFAIDGSYFIDSDSTATLAQQRIDSVRASLIAAGVPMRLISANTPTYSEPEDDMPDENSATTITIVSASDCR